MKVIITQDDSNGAEGKGTTLFEAEIGDFLTHYPDQPDKVLLLLISSENGMAVRGFKLNDMKQSLEEVDQDTLLKSVRAKLGNSSIEKKLGMTMFRQVSITKNGDLGRPFRWRTSKVQQLFLYLLQKRFQLVGKRELVELLWPEYEEKKAYSQLYTAIYHIRKMLKPYEHHFEIRSVSEGYMLVLHHVTLDVDEFEQMASSSIPVSEETIREYERVMRMYNGDYLEQYDYVWAERERARLRSLWITTASVMLTWYKENRRTEAALRMASQLTEADPLNEMWYLELMKLYKSTGQYPYIRSAYRKLEQTLSEELETEPGKEIRDWFEQFLKEHPPAKKKGPRKG
ncbi:AfsR/SARP family transcriptional regulator [Alkalicoccus urumqiensis]|uniref:Response regulator receiver protein n=1 Tax=Alkalicoccus urumqiensis TaxID=1548213 RepID=A0A2P6MIR4_ALKUR|nr:BTAD domain-containing putative transcriptional regulator [Alkalicoccus urumqiensis]PRO66157.1 response regulator receiver protein [Alkalicoccus urumqiensis]